MHSSEIVESIEQTKRVVEEAISSHEFNQEFTDKLKESFEYLNKAWLIVI